MSELEQRKIQFALITIFLEYIDDVLKYSNFSDFIKLKLENTSMKYKDVIRQVKLIENKIEKAESSKNFLLNLAFGNQSYEKIDEHKEEIIKYAFKILQGEYHLKDEKNG